MKNEITLRDEVEVKDGWRKGQTGFVKRLYPENNEVSIHFGERFGENYRAEYLYPITSLLKVIR